MSNLAARSAVERLEPVVVLIFLAADAIDEAKSI
jgi:hypothetical protein